MVAHVLSNLPLPLQWGLAVLVFGGALAVFALRRKPLRIAGGVAAGCGLAALAASWVLSPALLVPAPYTLRIVSPAPDAHVGSPLTLTVCGIASSGGRVPATDDQHYLAVFIDGVEVPTVDVWQVPEELPAGTHTLEVELVTPAHQAFDPPAIARETVTVTPGAPPAGPGSC